MIMMWSNISTRQHSGGHRYHRLPITVPIIADHLSQGLLAEYGSLVLFAVLEPSVASPLEVERSMLALL